MTENARPSGLYEHIHGVSDLDSALSYWHQLGFAEVARGRLPASAAAALYGVDSAVESVRLRHRNGAQVGQIRLHRWDRPLGAGLGHAPPLTIGSRWSGFYTRDILQLHEAYVDDNSARDAHWQVNDLARLFISDMTPEFRQSFVGLREFFLTGPEHRHAFLQRVGFDRPGFGIFAEGTPLSCSESTHGNIVMADLATARFYRDALGLVEQTPVQRLGWQMPAIRQSMRLSEGDVFSVEVLGAPETPSGLLRVYAAESPIEDLRAVSQPGHLGLNCYSYAYAPAGLNLRHGLLAQHGATGVTELLENEFGERSTSFVAPDGYFWTLVELAG